MDVAPLMTTPFEEQKLLTDKDCENIPDSLSVPISLNNNFDCDSTANLTYKSQESGYWSAHDECDGSQDTRQDNNIHDNSIYDNITGRLLSEKYPSRRQTRQRESPTDCPQFAVSRDQLNKQTQEQSMITTENQTSEIFIQTPMGTKHAGFSIRTDERSHRVTNVGKLYFPDMGLRDDDKLLAIQDVDVADWDHYVIADFIQHIFDPEIHVSALTLTIQRNETRVNISMEFNEDDFNTGAKNLVMEIHRNISYTTRPFQKVKMVEFTGECTCMIRHQIGESDYLYFKADRDKLTLDYCRDGDNEKMYHFKRLYFTGIQTCKNQSNQLQSVVFCVFVSVISNQVLSLKGFTSLGLLDQPVDKDIRCVRHPDPRFFGTDRTLRGTTERINSLVYPDLFVACRKRKLTLTNNKSGQDVEFEIHDIEQLPADM